MARTSRVLVFVATCTLVACQGGVLVDIAGGDASTADGSDFGKGSTGVPYDPGIPRPSGVTKPYDCTFVARPNCWRDVVDSGLACSPGLAKRATLNADRLTCVYEDGGKIVFADPLPSELKPNTVGIGIGTPYEVRGPDGAVCLRVRRIAGGTAVDSPAGTVAFQVIEGKAAKVTCPNGDVYESATPVLDCPGVANVLNGRLPSVLWSTNLADEYQGGFSGASVGATSAFVCSLARR